MPLLRPDRYFSDVRAIDLESLAAEGIEGLLLDLDNTVLPRDTSEVPDSARAWVRSLGARGFKVCFVSNNWHERVHAVAADLGAPIIAKALKPLPFAFRRAMRTLGLSPRACAVVGDQLFTDVLGGHLIGAMTVLVKPLSRSDLPHTLVLRLVEARVLADREPEA